MDVSLTLNIPDFNSSNFKCCNGINVLSSLHHLPIISLSNSVNLFQIWISYRKVLGVILVKLLKEIWKGTGCGN